MVVIVQRSKLTMKIENQIKEKRWYSLDIYMDKSIWSFFFKFKRVFFVINFNLFNILWKSIVSLGLLDFSQSRIEKCKILQILGFTTKNTIFLAETPIARTNKALVYCIWAEKSINMVDLAISCYTLNKSTKLINIINQD